MCSFPSQFKTYMGNTSCPKAPALLSLDKRFSNLPDKKSSRSGNSKIDQARLAGKKVVAFKSWGKHFLICLKEFTLRVHFLLFGSYRVNEAKDAPVRLNLTFPNGELNLYSCSLKFIEGDINDHYDWTADVMNDNWDPKQARRKLDAVPDKLICDALLEQDIFAGVGNIIKNEVLYRVFVHPESLTGKIHKRKLTEIIRESRTYSFAPQPAHHSQTHRR